MCRERAPRADLVQAVRRYGLYFDLNIRKRNDRVESRVVMRIKGARPLRTKWSLFEGEKSFVDGRERLIKRAARFPVNRAIAQSSLMRDVSTPEQLTLGLFDSSEDSE
jgi:hypothetical protein